MGFIALKCPTCGADIQLDDSREYGFCSFCGTKIVQDKTVVEHRGTIKVVDNKFETAFARANNNARLFFDCPDKVKYEDKVGLSAVLSMYSAAEDAGGSCNSLYWETLADFYVDAHIHELKKEHKIIPSIQDFISTFSFYMNNAIQYAGNDPDRRRLHDKKDKRTKELPTELYELNSIACNDYLNKAYQLANTYFESPSSASYKNTYGLGAVMSYYNDIGTNGCSAYCKYWSSLADFYAKDSINKIKQASKIIEGSKPITIDNGFPQQYKSYMDNAIKTATSTSKKDELIKQHDIILREWVSYYNKYQAKDTKALGIIAIATVAVILIIIIITFIVS